MKAIIILLASVLLGLSSCAQNGETNTGTEQTSDVVKRVSKTEFKKVLSGNTNLQLIDVRTPREFSNGKIGEAVNIDFTNSSFETKINALDKSKLTLIYCQSGGRSAKALAKMKDLGFTNVLELEGGYSQW